MEQQSLFEVDVNPLSKVRPENVPEEEREKERHYPERKDVYQSDLD